MSKSRPPRQPAEWDGVSRKPRNTRKPHRTCPTCYLSTTECLCTSLPAPHADVWDCVHGCNGECVPGGRCSFTCHLDTDRRLAGLEWSE